MAHARSLSTAGKRDDHRRLVEHHNVVLVAIATVRVLVRAAVHVRDRFCIAYIVPRTSYMICRGAAVGQIVIRPPAA